MKIRPVGAVVIHADRQTDRRTYGERFFAIYTNARKMTYNRIAGLHYTFPTPYSVTCIKQRKYIWCWFKRVSESEVYIIQEFYNYHYLRQARKYTCNVILRRVRVTIFALEKQYVLGKWPTWRTNSFLCIYFYFSLSTCFKHIVLIISRDKFCQYNLW